MNEYDPDYRSHPCNTFDELCEDEALRKLARGRIDIIDEFLDVIVRGMTIGNKPPESFWRNRICNWLKGKGKKEV